MKKLFVASLLAVMLLAPTAVTLANSATVAYSSCLTTSDGKPLANMEVRVDGYPEGFSDQDGCFTAQVETANVHDITYLGLSSLLSIVPDSNGFYYTFTYRTDFINTPTTENRVIPVTAVTVEVNGVDNTPIIDPVLELTGMQNLTLPDGTSMYIRVRGDINQMTGVNNTVLLGVPDGMDTTFSIVPPANSGYQRLDQQLPAPTGGQQTVQAVLEYPAPDTVDNVTSTVDATGQAALYWTAAPGTSSVKIYAMNNSGQQLIATLPASATMYDLGQLPHEGSYSYTIKAANQYGFVGNSARGISVNWDLTAPTIDYFNLLPASIETGTQSNFSVHYSDAETNVLLGEYYIGTDPGVGNGTVFSSTGDDAEFNDPIGSDLPAGTYTVGVRALDVGGNWSTTTTTALEVHDPAIVPDLDN